MRKIYFLLFGLVLVGIGILLLNGGSPSSDPRSFEERMIFVIQETGPTFGPGAPQSIRGNPKAAWSYAVNPPSGKTFVIVTRRHITSEGVLYTASLFCAKESELAGWNVLRITGIAGSSNAVRYCRSKDEFRIDLQADMYLVAEDDRNLASDPGIDAKTLPSALAEYFQKIDQYAGVVQ